jgi:hypothetical protein
MYGQCPFAGGGQDMDRYAVPESGFGLRSNSLERFVNQNVLLLNAQQGARA